MSLWIETDSVAAVLLADGWHTVADNSFDLDAYEYHHHHRVLMAGGQVEGAPSAGFSFIDDAGEQISGPVTSILAVKSYAIEQSDWVDG